MIPKIIHYCWFGDKSLGESEFACIETWKKMLPDYRIFEWNEKNFSLENTCEYVKQAYSEKKWAFVSDYVRMAVLYKYGGIYLDTDVEVIRSFNPLLDENAFICSESLYSMCTATIGAKKHADIILEFLRLYNNRSFVVNGKIDYSPNSKLLFNYLHDKYGYISNNNICNINKKITIYPSCYFSPLNCYTMKEFRTSNTYSIHRYSATWKNKHQKFKDKLLVLLTRIIGENGRDFLKKLFFSH